MKPPKPGARPERVSLWRYWRMFRRDLLSAQPEKLYSAKMAEFRTPFFRSFLVNDLPLVRRILNERPEDFPKSNRVTSGLRPLLGRSVFVTNGEEWEHQRRIIDPAFEKGRVKESFAAISAAADAMTERMSPGQIDAEVVASHATADVIFRTLFSIPIETEVAAETYAAFQTFQRGQPVANLSALIPWLPAWHSRQSRDAAANLRRLIGALVAERRAQIEAGTAPDDLATKIMTTSDPESGVGFSETEMVDQVAIFFLAGHETSAALLGWTLWCLAAAPEWQDKVTDEARAFAQDRSFSALSALPVTLNVLREVLRLYPPVPMLVREAAVPQAFRKRAVPKGAQIVLSPWHLGRHTDHWTDPDAFNPARWDAPTPRAAWLPFSSGQRVCPGAGFAMVEATVLLARLLETFEVATCDDPVPVAHLTVRSKDGIRLTLSRRAGSTPQEVTQKSSKDFSNQRTVPEDHNLT